MNYLHVYYCHVEPTGWAARFGFQVSAQTRGEEAQHPILPLARPIIEQHTLFIRTSFAPQALCVFAMALLFRVLSTTAEDYFSPILTQMAKDFYLPPRLAGGAGCVYLSSSCCQNVEYAVHDLRTWCCPMQQNL